MSSPVRSQLDPLRQVRVSVRKWRGAAPADSADEVVAEEPLEIRVCGTVTDGTAACESLAVIMRTPGHDDELAAGFLLSEGLLAGRHELAALRPGQDADGLPSDNVLDVVPTAGVDLVRRARAEGYSRKFAVNASCGVCGKNSVEAACATLPAVPLGGMSVSLAALYSLPEQLRAGQRVFAHTGGLHAAGLFTTDGTLVALREDIGRHNAVDKLLGHALLDGALPLGGHILLVSGRLSFEIVLKALAARIPVVAAVSAPSSLAVDLAESGGITLAAFLRGASVNVYTHAQRIRQA